MEVKGYSEFVLNPDILPFYKMKYETGFDVKLSGQLSVILYVSKDRNFEIPGVIQEDEVDKYLRSRKITFEVKQPKYEKKKIINKEREELPLNEMLDDFKKWNITSFEMLFRKFKYNYNEALITITGQILFPFQKMTMFIPNLAIDQSNFNVHIGNSRIIVNNAKIRFSDLIRFMEPLFSFSYLIFGNKMKLKIPNHNRFKFRCRSC